MSNLQINLDAIQDTVSELADIINNASLSSGNTRVIDSNTSFIEYPGLLRSTISSLNGGLVTLFAYRVSDVYPGAPEDNGDFDFETGVQIAPKNWCTADELNVNESDTVWMTQALFMNKSNVVHWSKPIRISSFMSIEAQGQTQQVYLCTESSLIPSKPVGTANNILNTESLSIGWNDSFPGMNINKPYIWTSIRRKTNKSWSDYSTPALYSYFAKDGKNGDSGIVNRIAFIFQSTTSRYDAPDVPTGGQWDVVTNNLILPDGWSESPETSIDRPYTWMSTASFTSENPINPSWTEPVCITGEDGVDGTDGSSNEFIYAILKNQDDYDAFKEHFINANLSLEVSKDDTVPNFIQNNKILGTHINVERKDGTIFQVQLTDSPIGITSNQKIEIYWTRTKTKDKWNGWVGPIYWSVWGENGMDGDGIEYIFTASNDSTCDTPLPVYANLLKENPQEAIRFQSKEYVPDGWYDNDKDWGGIGPDVPYLFCSSRKQYKDEVTGKQMWSDFSEPKIWGHWGKDGIGSYTSFAFCISKDDLSGYTVSGGYYGNALKGLVTKNNNGEIVDIKWHDSIPEIPKFDESIWMINKFFDNSADEENDEWFGPTKMSDSEHFQVEFNCPVEGDPKSIYDPARELISLQEFKNLKSNENITFESQEDLEAEWRKYVYEHGYGLWNDGGSGAVYMATARYVNNQWEKWSVNRVKGESGDSSQFIFKLTDGDSPDNPNPIDLTGDYQNDSYIPRGWSHSPLSVSEDMPICWVSTRFKTNGVWEAYSAPAQWSMYAKGNIHLELSEDQINIPCESDGSVDKDYFDFVINNISLYDNGALVYGTYEAIINDDIDFKIDSVLNEKPSDTSVSGFFGNSLYIGRDFLDRYVDKDKLRVECRVIYNSIPYSKAFFINKSTNTYEIKISHKILHLNSNGVFKDPLLEVQAFKWVEDRFIAQNNGYVEYIINKSDGTVVKSGDNMDEDTIETIDLSSFTNVKDIIINYKSSSSSDILASETIGTVIDGKDGEDGKDGKSVTKVIEWYAKHTSNTSAPTSGWSTNVSIQLDSSYKYLWNKEEVYINDVLTTTSAPQVIGTYSEDGVGIKSIQEFYKKTSNDSVPQIDNTWVEKTPPVLDSTDRYLWNYEVITYTNNDTYTSQPCLIGVHGKDGKDGTNGGFGPMARYSIWGKDAPDNNYYDRTTAASESEPYPWYDMVEHDGKYYLCNKKHEVNKSPKPGVGEDWTAYWIESSHFDLITAKNAMIENLVAERIQAEKVISESLQTKSINNGPWIHIQNGEFKVYKDNNKNTQASIIFGQEANGDPRLEFWDNNGNLLYILGPDGGYRDVNNLVYKELVPKGPFYIYTLGYDTGNHKESMSELVSELSKTNTYWDIPVELYLQTWKENGVPKEDDGCYYINSSKSELVSNTYLSDKRSHGFLDSLKDDDISSLVDEFNESYHNLIDKNRHAILNSATLQIFSEGKPTFTEQVFWLTEV